VSSIGCSETAQPPWQVFGGENDDNWILFGRNDLKKSLRLTEIFCYLKIYFEKSGCFARYLYLCTHVRAVSSGSKSERWRGLLFDILFFNIRLCCRILERLQAE